MLQNVTQCHNLLQNVFGRFQGFATGDGVIIVGGFFTKAARESSYAKMSLGTVPKVAIHEPNKTLKVVTDFLEALRVSQHKAIFDTYRYYNAQGGRVLTLQSSNQVQYTHVFICCISDIMR